jgi:hypothetical protein
MKLTHHSVFQANSGRFFSIHELHPPQMLVIFSLLSTILQLIAKKQHLKALRSAKISNRSLPVPTEAVVSNLESWVQILKSDKAGNK